MIKQVQYCMVVSNFYYFCFNFYNCTYSFELCPLPPQQCPVSYLDFSSRSQGTAVERQHRQRLSHHLTTKGKRRHRRKRNIYCIYAEVFLLFYSVREILSVLEFKIKPYSHLLAAIMTCRLVQLGAIWI